ncbi:MAG: septum formation initiator family protein, partial [Muribaculaceae bacterium]|nr:septum formation initiator family protein [Muribaculaceae bacterium]
LKTINDKVTSGMNTLKAIRDWCRRYISLTLIAVLAFMAFVLFFNENSVMKGYELNREIERLKAEIKENTDSMNYYLHMNELLRTDRETMERVVREQYHMQRDNEDVYVFID